MHIGDPLRFEVKAAPEDDTIYIMDHRSDSCALILSYEQARKLMQALLIVAAATQ